ncbi:ABC transporter permease [Aureimonas fodinaquatilis]|uniref:ABC transporter permease n=1 Tax=Aureimonas fodinaquatilis TaxID=2565783 RepID=A0A5B0DST2_9HYPH|nr:ABC transporter permease [Aureimonas fodinaquatilis]KAA0969526.1 ABC transporter permease [Aureimonas fodinaquatilis]
MTHQATLTASAPPAARRRFNFSKITPWLWLAPAIALFVPFFIIPMAVVFRYSFNRDDPMALMVSDFTFENYANILTDTYYLTVFSNSVLVSLGVTLGTLALGYPFAYFLVRYARKSRGFLLWAVYLPLMVSVIVRAFGWIVITADTGLINSVLLGLGILKQPLIMLFELESMVPAMIHRYLPLMVLPLINAIGKIDDTLYSASANLGAGRLRTFRRVIFPLTAPGIVAGSQLVFANVLSDFVIPNLLGSTRFRLLAPVIYEEAAIQVAWATAASLAIVMLIIVSLMLLISNITFRRLAPWARTL